MTTTITSAIKKLLLLFLIIAGLHYGKEFLIPLIIGGILATLFLPLTQYLEQKKLPKIVAVLSCFLLLTIIISCLFSLLAWQIGQLISEMGLIKHRGLEIANDFQQFIYNHFNISIENQLTILQKEQPSYSNMVQMLMGFLTTAFTKFVLTMIYFLFLLYYRSHLKAFLIQLAVPSQKSELENIIQKTTKISQQYLIGLSKMIFLLWVMYGIGFSIIGVENAIFFAILCGLMEIVPYIGNLTGTILTVFVASLHGANPSLIGGILIVYGAVQLIQGWILEPMILGPQVKINPLFTIIALVLGELLWGIPGIILAIPLVAMLKILFDSINPLKPYGFLIGEIEKRESVL
jgi:predicted PurR-regulated permease PerM